MCANVKSVPEKLVIGGQSDCWTLREALAVLSTTFAATRTTPGTDEIIEKRTKMATRTG